MFERSISEECCISTSRTSSFRRSSTASSSVMTWVRSSMMRGSESTSSFPLPTSVFTTLRAMNSISSAFKRMDMASISAASVCYRRRAMPLHVVRHPLVEDALGRLRDHATPCEEFRRLARRVSLLVAVEATRDLSLSDVAVQHAARGDRGPGMSSRVVAVPVLRAGIGMLEAFLELVPQAEVGYFGLERNEETAAARRYYEKVPKDLAKATVFLLDPMLATGGSAAMAVDGLAGLGARRVRLLSIVAAPEGVQHLEAWCRTPSSIRRPSTARG